MGKFLQKFAAGIAFYEWLKKLINLTTQKLKFRHKKIQSQKTDYKLRITSAILIQGKGLISLIYKRSLKT